MKEYIDDWHLKNEIGFDNADEIVLISISRREHKLIGYRKSGKINNLKFNFNNISKNCLEKSRIYKYFNADTGKFHIKHLEKLLSSNLQPWDWNNERINKKQ